MFSILSARLRQGAVSYNLMTTYKLYFKIKIIIGIDNCNQISLWNERRYQILIHVLEVIWLSFGSDITYWNSLNEL
jgi:hypothetical protein